MSKFSRTAASLTRIVRARKQRAMARPELRLNGGRPYPPKCDPKTMKLIEDHLAKHPPTLIPSRSHRRNLR